MPSKKKLKKKLKKLKNQVEMHDYIIKRLVKHVMKGTPE